jgi:hypothetical protein
MFFLLRSAFWLGLVFSQMTWPQDGLAPALPAAVRVGADVAAKACGARPRDCLAVVATLARAR